MITNLENIFLQCRALYR